MTKFVEVDILRNIRLNFHYRVTSTDNRYYLIPTHQSFIQRVLPFLNWGLLIKAYEITVEDFQKLTNLQQNVRRNSLKVALGTGLGLVIGGVLSSYISRLMGSVIITSEWLNFLSLFLVITFGFLIYLLMGYWTGQHLKKLGINLSKPVRVKIKPVKWFLWFIRCFLVWILSYAVAISTIGGFIETGNSVNLLLLLVALLMILYIPNATLYKGPYVFKME